MYLKHSQENWSAILKNNVCDLRNIVTEIVNDQAHFQ